MKLLALSFVIFISNLNAQNSFPNNFVGNWQGDIEIYGVKTINMKIGMSLNIQPTEKDSIYTWEITYQMNDTTRDVRIYELVVLDKEQGLYVIDEKNGIIMESYFLHHTFTTFFSVLGNNLIFSYALENNKLIVDVFFSPEKSINQTGGGVIDNEDIPLVKTFKVSGRQHAVLSKKN